MKKEKPDLVDNPTFLNKKKAKPTMKEIREKQYSNISLECAKAKLNISEIKIEDFAESRKRELTNFIKILNTKFNTKGGFQSLPRHMRRRAMTHNPFRVSINSRVLEANTKSKSKCKKHKRMKK